MSSESLDLEMSFNSEMNFITEYKLQDKGQSSRVSPLSQETLSDSSDDNAAYTDEPLADTEWIKKYQEEMKANEALERSLKDPLQGNVELTEWRDLRVSFSYALRVLAQLILALLFMYFLDDFSANINLLNFRYKCGNCNVALLKNISECYCCCELEGCEESMKSDLVIQYLAPDVNLTCITEHPGLYPLCLQKWSLRLAADKVKTKGKERYRQTGSEGKGNSKAVLL